jgi:hypothetical protein
MGSAWTCGTTLVALVLFLGLGSDARRVEADEAPAPLLELPSPRFFVELARLDLQVDNSPDELWPILDRCRDELMKEWDANAESRPWNLVYECARVGEALARASARDEPDRVFDLFDTLPAQDPLRHALLAGLLAGRLAEAVRELTPPPAATAPILPLPGVPDSLAEAAPELQRAWQRKEALSSAYSRRLEDIQESGEVPVHEGQDQFQASIARFLRGRSPASEAVSSVGRYVWGGGCGMGSGLLLGPQSRTLLLAFLDLGDLDAAAGALLSTSWLHEFRDQTIKGVDRELLARMGFDWEQIFLGRVLDGDPLAARALAQHGSDQAARWLFEARRLPSHDGETPLGDGEDYLHALAALVSPTGHCSAYATASSLDLARADDAEPVGADLEAEVLRLLESHAEPGSSQSEAETAAHLLVRACRTESVPAFRKMARSPYSRVREAGALALRALGERAPAPRPNRPVAFTLSVDGAPLRQGKVLWSLARTSETGSTSSSGTTADDGTLALERDPFLDPKNVVDTVTLSTGDMDTPRALWFAVRVPSPERLDRPVPVPVKTQSLTVLCPDAEPGTLKLSLEAPTSRWGARGMFFPILGNVELGKEPLTFARLQRGRYRLRLLGEAGVWHSDPIALGTHPVTVTCGPLEPDHMSVAASAVLLPR